MSSNDPNDKTFKELWAETIRSRQTGFVPKRSEQAVNDSNPASSMQYPTRILVPTLRELGFRVKKEYVDGLDLLVEGVRELRRLQALASDIERRSMLSNWGLYCDLEIVTDELREQQDDQWRVSVLLRRIGRKRVRAADFRWAAAEIRAWAKEHGLI